MRPQRVFGVDYQFLACGDVFTTGLLRAAADLKLVYDHAESRRPDLADRIAAFRPDFIFVVHGRIAHNRLGRAAERVPKAVWLLDEPYEVDDTSRFSRHFTQVFVNDPSTLHRHPGAVYLPVCYDPHLHRPAGPDRPYRVGFIGGGNRIRDRYLDALAAADCLDYVIGGDWFSPRVRAKTLSRNVSPKDTTARYQQTRIILNVFRETHHYNREGIPAVSMNPRIYEALACGALVISERRPEIIERVPDLPTFTTVAGCLEAVRHFLAHPDEAAAVQHACRDRLAGDTYASRLETVLRHVSATTEAPVC